jgi:hypothetical protein
MCTSPKCPNGCQASRSGMRTNQLHMYRAYIKVYDQNRKQRSIPVGWWSPGCPLFIDDIH